MFRTSTVIDANVARTATLMFHLRAKLMEPFRSDLASFAIWCHMRGKYSNCERSE